MAHHQNFLEQQDQTPVKPPSPTRRRVRKAAPLVVIGCVIVVVLYLIVAAIGTGRVFAASLDAQDDLKAAETAASALDFTTAQTSLDAASADIARAQSGLAILTPLKLIPWVGDQVRAISDVLHASDRLIPSLKDIVTIAANLVDVVNRAKELSAIPTDQQMTYLTMPASVRHDLLQKLHQSQSALETIKARLTLAEADVLDLDKLNLATPIQKAVEPFRVLLPQLSQAIDFLIPVSAITPEFAGLNGPTQTLVLFENNTELRPGGGFIGTFGTLTTQDGAMIGLTSQDSYSIDGPATDLVKTIPPAPLTQYLGANVWYFRDANWSPDFSVSAKQSVDALASEQVLIGQTPVAYSGVIALTPTFAAHILDLVGPVTIADQTFTSQNIADELEYQVELGFVGQGIPQPQRKEIVGALVQEVMNRLFNLPLSSWSQVITASLASIQEKQLMFWSANADTQNVLVTSGWAGTIKPNDADHLMVVDANLGSLKSDPDVKRSVLYRVRQNEQGRLVAQTQITYTHTGSFDWKTTRYRTYTRLYVPLGSTLIRADGTLLNDKLTNPSLKPGPVDTIDDLGFTSFGAFTSIEPGETHVLEFDYYLPDSLAMAIKNGTYQLQVDKELGAQNNELTVDLDFGKPLSSATPAEDPSQFGNTQYLVNSVLDKNQSFVVRY